MGEPQSGKTAYLSLILGLLQRCSGQAGNFSMMPSAEQKVKESKEYITLNVEDMKRGIWPDKTRQLVTLDYHVRHNRFVPALGPWLGTFGDPFTTTAQKNWPDRIIDFFARPWMCKRTIRFYDCMGELFQGELSDEAQEASLASDSFLFFFDAEMVKNEPKGRDTPNCVERINDIIQERCKKEGKICVAIVFTKCDTVEKLCPSNAPSAKGEGLPFHQWNDETIINWFKERYASRLTSLAYMQGCGKLCYKYFCVSCLPNPAHRKADRKKGLIGNASWDLIDMRDQAAPLCWLSQGFPLF